MTCPHCGQAAEFHSHRRHTSFSLVGPIRYRRAYYLCRLCGQGLFPFDRDAGLTARDLTPALERVATLAGAVADSFEKGAELLEEMAGVRLSESTVERTTEDAGQRLADAVAAGATFGPKVDWPWHKDYDGKRCAYVELDATGVRQQGAGGGPAEGRMAYVGMVCNPSPEWPWPDEKPQPMQARYLSGLYPLEEFAPLLRTPAGHVGMDRADRWIGLSDGGNGLEDRLRENFPRVEVIILDFFHPAEKLTGLARLLHPQGRGPGRRSSPAVAAVAQGRRRRGAGGGPARMGLAASAGPARGGRRADRLPRAERAPDGVPRIPGPGLVHRQRRGGERVQDGGRPTPEAGRDALGRGRRPRRLPPPRPLPQRERPVGRLLETRFLPQLIVCTHQLT